MSLLQFLNNGYFAGKVGIGTNSPDGLLHVSSGTSGDALVIIESDTDNNDENDNPQLQFKQDGGNTIAKIGLSGDAGTIFTNSLANTAYFGNDEAASVQLYTNATARLTVESGGNVGIGTTSPAQVLHTNTSSNVVLLGESTSASNTAYLYLKNATSTSTYTVGYGSAGDDAIITAGGAERMRIDSAGAIKFNAYGAGTLVTDSDGNITASSGGGAGGPYLPLAGGTMTGNTVHNDNVKSIYGTASDGLEIYHDGTDSIIADTGTGNLYIRGAASMRLQGINQSNFFIASQGGSVNLYYNNANKFDTTNTGINVTGEIQLNTKALLSNQENTDIDSAAAEVVAQVSITDYTAAFFDFVVKKGTNVRSGTVYACHDGTNVEFTETSTNDLGDTSDVTLSVDKTSTNLRLIATVTSDDWSVKSLIRAI